MEVKELEQRIAELIRRFEEENGDVYVNKIELTRFILLTGTGGLTLSVHVKLGKTDDLYEDL